MIIQDKIDIEIKTKNTKTSIKNKYDIDSEIGDIVWLPWEDFKTSSYRGKKVKVSCDNCGKEFDRKIRDLIPDEQYCLSCGKLGELNPMYGKKVHPNSVKGILKWMEENGNPAQRPGMGEKISKSKKLSYKKSGGSKLKGRKLSEETKQKISKTALKQFQTGERKVSSGWGNVEIKQYKGIDYQSKYELKFLKHMENKNLLKYVERGPKIIYEIDGVEHTYFSDYRIKNTNLVIEIKSDYFWKKKLKINLLKKAAAEKLYDYIVVMNNKFEKIDKKLNEVMCEKT